MGEASDSPAAQGIKASSAQEADSALPSKTGRGRAGGGVTGLHPQGLRPDSLSPK